MNNRTFRRRFRNLSVLCALLFFFAPHPSRAYSFLTHESIIDLAWDPAIKPLLLKRYPHTTATGLRIAHGYAYGGSTIQDAGYYPFGKDFFSDLTHYVRTGAFVTALLRDSRNVDEFAFALGALSHYVGDAIGHSYAVNPAVAIEFPGLHRQYGKIITYEDSPHSHVRTEFAFDIDQLSKDRFAPTAYLRSVGMYVPRRLMNQAFYETYGLSLRSVLGNERVAFRGYRSSVRQFLTRVAYAEVLLHRKRMPPDVNTPQFREFQARLQTAGQQNHWQRFRTHHIGFSTRFYAFLILIVPKVGSLSDLSIRGPNQATEQRYIYSVNDAVDEYDFLIGTIGRVGVRNFSLPNLDLDTGFPSFPGSYALTDKTYAKLLDRITRPGVAPHVPEALKDSVLAYYANPNAPDTLKKHRREWRRVQADLALLRQKPALPAHLAYIRNLSAQSPSRNKTGPAFSEPSTLTQ
ncbi:MULTISPECIES: zinc dependent phospholipase C family protein [Acidobacterium]|nr:MULTISPECIES: zinc dependent phospholipase C family protein [Acidobacterium]HCT60641.1 hypothetical protein [Acidobacterium sp.]